MILSTFISIEVLFSILAWTTSTVTAFQLYTVGNKGGHCGHHHRSIGTNIPQLAQRISSNRPITSTTITPNNPAPTTTSLQAYDVLSVINSFYQTKPYEAAFLTCGIKASAADLLAQTRSMKQTQNDHMDDEDMISSPDVVSNTSSIQPNIGQGILASSKQVQSMNIMLNNLRSTVTKPFSSDVPTTTNSAAAVVSHDEISNDNTLEVQRNVAFILYGGLYQGMAQEYIYNYLFPVWFGVGNDISTVFTKVAFDLIVVSPLICIPIAYIVKAIIYRKDWWMDGIGKYIHDLRYKNLLLTYYSIWFPAGLCSFGLVPDHLRIAFIAFVSFFWLIILSTISSSSKEGGMK